MRSGPMGPRACSYLVTTMPPLILLAERLIGGVRHLPRGLSDGHKADAAGERGVFQRAADRRVRLHGPEGAVQDRFRSFTKLLIHAVFLPTDRAGPLVFC